MLDGRTEQDLLADLTFAQQEAVMHFEGPLLILAGAGSGKTRVITRRVAWLMQQGVRHANILAITFTNKAAAEMRHRVDALVTGHKAWISTFHSLGARLLRLYADRLDFDRNFTIYDMEDRNKVVKRALETAGMDNTKFSPEQIGSGISKAKNQLQTPEKYAATSGDFYTQVVARIYGYYQKMLRDANAMDFDDLLFVPALALKYNEEFRNELSSRFKFVLIDEYQDTNHAQYQIVRCLAHDVRNICVVGDPDQSIYKFRGSDIRNILDFERDFPDAKVITLDRNYRSTPSILRAADYLIQHNRYRKAKSLIAENPEGEPVRLMIFDTGLTEADGIIARIKEGVNQKKFRYRDTAIFLRMNALSRSIETACIKHGVPFQIVKGLAFYDRKENKDVLAYLRLLVNPLDQISFLRAVNEPARGIGKVSLEHLQSFAQDHEISLMSACADVAKISAIKGKAASGLLGFSRLMMELRTLVDQSPETVIREVLDRSGYRDMLKFSGNEEDQERLANIEELMTAAKQVTKENPAITIGEFLEQITLAGDIDSWDEKQDCVSIMTLHSAKGLEFPVVFIPTFEQGLVPHERSLEKEEDVEEERRLAFVGITRAMRELYLSYARARDFRGQERYTTPSMFLRELPEEVETLDLSQGGMLQDALDTWRGGSKAAAAAWADTGVVPIPLKPTAKPIGMIGATAQPDEFEVGLIVQHAQYGIGQITEVSGFGAMRKVRIRFATSGEKMFVASKVQVKIVRRK